MQSVARRHNGMRSLCMHLAAYRRVWACERGCAGWVAAVRCQRLLCPHAFEARRGANMVCPVAGSFAIYRAPVRAAKQVAESKFMQARMQPVFMCPRIPRSSASTCQWYPGVVYCQCPVLTVTHVCSPAALSLVFWLQLCSGSTSCAGRSTVLPSLIPCLVT